MSDSWDVSARYIAAGSSKTSVQCLEEWALDSSPEVRCRVAENPRTPLHSLVLLAKDPSTEVRIAVSENPFTPKWLLEELFGYDDPDLRYSMAEIKNCPGRFLPRSAGTRIRMLLSVPVRQ